MLDFTRLNFSSERIWHAIRVSLRSLRIETSTRPWRDANVRFKSYNGNLTNSPINKPSKTMFVDHELLALKVKNMIERKGLIFPEDDLWMTWSNVSTNSTHINSFSSALWTNPARKTQSKGLELIKNHAVEHLAWCLFFVASSRS